MRLRIRLIVFIFSFLSMFYFVLSSHRKFLLVCPRTLQARPFKYIFTRTRWDLEPCSLLYSSFYLSWLCLPKRVINIIMIIIFFSFDHRFIPICSFTGQSQKTWTFFFKFGIILLFIQQSFKRFV